MERLYLLVCIAVSVQVVLVVTHLRYGHWPTLSTVFTSKMPTAIPPKETSLPARHRGAMTPAEAAQVAALTSEEDRRAARQTLELRRHVSASAFSIRGALS